jgi:hypothetical protein
MPNRPAHNGRATLPTPRSSSPAWLAELSRIAHARRPRSRRLRAATPGTDLAAACTEASIARPARPAAPLPNRSVRRLNKPFFGEPRPHTVRSVPVRCEPTGVVSRPGSWLKVKNPTGSCAADGCVPMSSLRPVHAGLLALTGRLAVNSLASALVGGSIGRSPPALHGGGLPPFGSSIHTPSSLLASASAERRGRFRFAGIAAGPSGSV